MRNYIQEALYKLSDSYPIYVPLEILTMAYTALSGYGINHSHIMNLLQQSYSLAMKQVRANWEQSFRSVENDFQLSFCKSA